MATAFNSSILSSTYRDDFRDSDQYYRILFNGGRALQARELTQLQTIINKEMERFGKNIFKEGACVSGSTVTINKSYDYIKLNTSGTGEPLPVDTTVLIGKEFRGVTSKVRFRILEVYTAAQTGDVDTIYVQYTGGTSDGAYVKATDNETLENSDGNGLDDLKSKASNATGTGTRISFGDGAFFVQGHFVFAPAQSLILAYYSNNYNGNVGFKVTQDIVTAVDNSALYDNQGVTPNTSAPGADRYRIQLTLIDEANVLATEDFIYYCTVKQSEIVAQVSATDNYAKINDLMAKRTYEESGNYIVKPFRASYSENDSSSDYLNLDVAPGTAYVYGYRAETQTAKTLAIAKPQTSVLESNVGIPTDFGNYVRSDSANAISIPVWYSSNSAGANGKPIKIGMLDSSGSSIGTTSVRALEKIGSEYRLYIFDTKLNDPVKRSFESDVKKLGDSAGDAWSLRYDTLNGVRKAIIQDPTNNNLFFDLPRTRPKDLTDISMAEQRIKIGTADASGNATLSIASGTLVESAKWIATLANGTQVTPGVTITGGGSGANLTGLQASQTYHLLYYVNITITAKSKTLTSATKTSVSSGDWTDSDGISYLTLGQADIYDIRQIKDSASGDSTGQNYIFDNGQRDNYYQHGRLILKPGLSKPTNTYVSFRYFAHGAGDFYSVNSYIGQVNYSDIPTFNSPSQGPVDLRDVLDFRPTRDGTISGQRFIDSCNLPINGSFINADIETYQPRMDKLVIDQNGVLINVQGTPDFNPKFPVTPDGTLELFKMSLNANTLNDSDVKMEAIDAKRYTMNDISKLDKQIQRLEELTTLSMLEVDTKNLQVLDSSGNARTKAGFVVDNFVDQAFADTKNIAYNAAIDPEAKLLRPSFIEDNIRLIYNSDSSANVTKIGDLVMLSYDSAEYQSINICSGTENINPFNVTSSRGTIRLSPASDEWRETKVAAEKVIKGGTKLDTSQALLWNNWEWNWSGKDLNDLEVGDLSKNTLTSTTPKRDYKTTSEKRADYWGDNRVYQRPALPDPVVTPSVTTVNRIVASETIREIIGKKVVDLALLPWIRSRKIYFKAEGLRPATRYFPYFDGKQVDNWVKQQTFQTFSGDSSELGTQYHGNTQHPETKSTLVSDSDGVIEGSFFIPYKQFKAGTRQFKLLDISGGLDNQALSIATTTYSAQGAIETTQQTVKTTRVLTVQGEQTSTSNDKKSDNATAAIGKISSPLITGPDTFVADNNAPLDNIQFSTRNVRQVGDTFIGDKYMFTRCGYRDPLAQSFFVNDITGVFITSLTAYFKTKDNNLPVTCQIRPMENGHPHSTKILATKTLTSSQVSVASTQTVAGALAAPTKFVFDEPIYLLPQEEYAIVLLADSNNYNVYVSEVGEFHLGSTSKRITTQPSLGSLFKSQNGRTWEPDQKKDLMMRLGRASFNKTSGDVRLRNARVPVERLPANPIKTTASDATVTILYPEHGLDSGDTFTLSNLTPSARYGGLLGSSLMTAKTVTHRDGQGFTFEADSTATSSTFSGGSNVRIRNRNIQFNFAKVDIQTMSPDLTGVGLRGKFTSGRSLTDSDGNNTRMIKDTTWSGLQFGKTTSFINGPKMIANRDRENLVVGSEGLGGNYSTEISVTLKTNSNFVSPIVDLQRASLTTIENRITDTIADPYTINSAVETAAGSGNELARHISIPVVLANASVGIKAYIAVNRPSAASVDFYYRVGDENTNLEQKDWTLLSPVSTPPPDDNQAIFRDYEYLAGGQNGVLVPFTKMQFKIVMRSTNSSKVPKIRDFRAIALID